MSKIWKVRIGGAPDSRIEYLDREDAEEFALFLAEKIARTSGINFEEIDLWYDEQGNGGACPRDDEGAYWPHFYQN